jgi:hypothetical protein
VVIGRGGGGWKGCLPWSHGCLMRIVLCALMYTCMMSAGELELQVAVVRC